MKICTIVGARPQFVKAAVVSRAFRENRPEVKEIIVHTGQHYDTNMSEIFFEQMQIPIPDYNLAVGSGSHAEMTGKQMIAIEGVLLKERPDLVLVYGDTNSTLAGALVAAKLHVPIAHVEAGLRSRNNAMPEEINRILTDRVSSMLFAPTLSAKENLLSEGVGTELIRLVGDVMCDATLFYRDQAKKPEWFDQIGLNGGFVLATLHRAENTDDPLRLASILRGLADAQTNVVMPLHPRTLGRLRDSNLSLGPNVHPVHPVGYLQMIWLEMNCAAIATDSGGIQKEAFFHGKRCVTLRDETEWTELVECGVNVLVGSDRSRIAEAIRLAVALPEPIVSLEIYGGGRAGMRIVEEIFT